MKEFTCPNCGDHTLIISTSGDRTHVIFGDYNKDGYLFKIHPTEEFYVCNNRLCNFRLSTNEIEICSNTSGMKSLESMHLIKEVDKDPLPIESIW